MMKTQESVMDMLKNVCGRVENLEKSNAALSSLEDHDGKKIPPELSVSSYFSPPPLNNYIRNSASPPPPTHTQRIIASVHKALDDDDQFQPNKG
jgi:hypothetical protein